MQHTDNESNEGARPHDDNENTDSAPPAVPTENHTHWFTYAERMNPDALPPLPLDPPPPEQIRNMNIALSTDTETGNGNADNVELAGGSKPNDDDESIPVCRDYIKKRCSRSRNCKYRHKYNPPHTLVDYKFCGNYQYTACHRSDCKYVHASLFEENHFYRTGYLPPRAFAHHRKPTVSPPVPPLLPWILVRPLPPLPPLPSPLPPPPPPPPPEESPPNAPSVFRVPYPPPAMRPRRRRQQK